MALHVKGVDSLDRYCWLLSFYGIICRVCKLEGRGREEMWVVLGIANGDELTGLESTRLEGEMEFGRVWEKVAGQFVCACVLVFYLTKMH